ncbi:hypothetical protein [Nocardioides sp. AE5]|uniref:class I SAM-dependent methyltransferase n=1 Tax=Nocardioides sp. AE5 TaxID=2962573 RepID=UPI002880EDD1|nr:hypothetical protein [Nocardioides sp. AE5]MDT0201053.1 hypothetical protein [Nocardioides sp. AE5]
MPQALVLRGDAQSADLRRMTLGRPFDRVVSRFGVMFFDNPIAALANIRTATAPAGTLAFVSWRAEEEDMFWHGLRRIAAHLPDPPPRPPVRQSGPLGLAEADHIHQVLAGAGWSDVVLEPFEAVCDFCLDGSDGVEHRLGWRSLAPWAPPYDERWPSTAPTWCGTTWSRKHESNCVTGRSRVGSGSRRGPGW